MGPTTRYVVRSTGCGRFLGLALILIGLIILLANSGLGPSWTYRRWWPVVIIAFGAYLLVRHYWVRLTGRSRVPDVIDSGVIPRFMGSQSSWRPPAFPVVVMAAGVWLLLDNLGIAKTWAIWAIVLIVAGLLFLGGSLRASVNRR